MGQAKNRGTPQEREQQALQRPRKVKVFNQGKVAAWAHQYAQQDPFAYLDTNLALRAANPAHVTDGASDVIHHLRLIPMGPSHKLLHDTVQALVDTDKPKAPAP